MCLAYDVAQRAQTASGSVGCTGCHLEQFHGDSTVPRLAGQGTPTASQTAWALLALLAADEGHGSAVRAGVEYLLATQREDGTWHEEPFTGTGFPKVFYLKYHLYSLYFPLMALARYQQIL